VTPEEIRGRLQGLRAAGEALRRRPAGEVLDLLARLLDGWSDPGSAWRRDLERELPAATGFAPPTAREGLRRGLAEWDGAALRTLVDRELGGVDRLDAWSGPAVRGFDTTAVLLAGSIPMPTLLSLVAPLVLRSPVLAKSASRDPVTPRLVARSIAETDAGLGRCIEVVSFPGEDRERSGAALGAGCVVATGSDATVQAVAARVGAPRRFVGYGHRLSVAALGAGLSSAGTLDPVAARLALDVALWDQLGCLSPVAVYAVGEPLADAVAESLARALAMLEQELPRGLVPPDASAAIAHERADAELRGAAGRRVALHGGVGSTWTVVREADERPRPAPLHRFVRVHPVDGVDGLLAALAPLSAHLAGVAVEGFGAETPHLARELAWLGASRVCRTGTLQAPPLGWHHDGQGVLSVLARMSDLELSV
jgi:hypothetical protein